MNIKKDIKGKKYIFLGIAVLFLSTILSFVFFSTIEKSKISKTNNITFIRTPTSTPTPVPLATPPNSKILEGGYHVFQTFNNCGPAALSMALAYFGIERNQTELGRDLRPYQIPGGDNDDKSVTLEELAEKSKEYGFVPFHRPNGTPELMKYFITYDIPVIARTWTKPNEDIGHYRIIKGYDDRNREIIQDDSLQNKNLRFTYEDFNIIWGKFNYEYLVLVPKDKVSIAHQILGEDVSEETAWKKAVENSENQLKANPNDIYSRFNLSVALYNTREYQRSVEEFEKVENLLPFRTLWYQIEPIQAYYELGKYDRVFEITDRVLNNYNRAFSELYIIRGNIYKNQGNLDAAKSEFEKALFYNSNLKAARQGLSSIDRS